MKFNLFDLKSNYILGLSIWEPPYNIWGNIATCICLFIAVVPYILSFKAGAPLPDWSEDRMENRKKNQAVGELASEENNNRR